MSDATGTGSDAMGTDAAGEPADRTLTLAPLLGALAVGLVVVLLLVFTAGGSDHHLGTSTDADGALTCPSTYEISSVAWVPIDPSGVDGNKYLVPNTKPGHVTMCHYKTAGDPANRTADARLDGHRTLSGDLSEVTRSLSKAVRGKPGAASCRTTQDDPDGSYLMGLTFATGVAWISAPGYECLGSTNGQFDTASLHTQFANAYAARVWAG